ncbi:MAG: phosphorybosylanthranilate isomerase [Gemmatimonadetes bacterium]|nr:MAG: phosphorybosylanthranilate isomerase [Gemmatimonadota bacterium]
MSPTRVTLDTLFEVPCPVVGMVHLRSLPGAPGWGGSMEAVIDQARADARALAEGGADGVMVENYGDVPFYPGRVPPETAAALALAVAAVRAEVGERPVGVNVLRNDARTAVGVAAATGAAFVRVNVHSGVMVTDQGVLEGRAHETLRERARLAPGVAILADVFVKHAAPPPGLALEDAARDTWHRGLADALIVSGAGTGRPTARADLERVRAAVPDAPVWIGSGLTAASAPDLVPLASGAIVGSALKRDGRAEGPVDAGRVRALVEAVRSAGG